MENLNEQQPQVVIVERKKGNGMGVAGFVLALLALLFCWIPVLNWILWILGVVFSAIGVFRPHKGLAITGLVISFIGILSMLLFIGAVLSL